LRSLLKFSGLIAAEQHAYCSGGKINFWSHLSEERPDTPQKFHRNPFRGRIESIKSAGKRSQKVTLITCPRHFLETLISNLRRCGDQSTCPPPVPCLDDVRQGHHRNMKIQVPHFRGGFEIMPNEGSVISACYSATSTLVVWLGSHGATDLPKNSQIRGRPG